MKIEISTEKGYRDVQNPRNDDGLLGTLVCFHRRYNLGDLHEFGTPQEFISYANKKGSGVVFFPVYLYDHGGINISMNSFRGVTVVGWVYTTKSMIRRVLNIHHITPEVLERVRKELESEVEEYDKYLNSGEGEEVWNATIVLYNEEGEVQEIQWVYDYETEAGALSAGVTQAEVMLTAMGEVVYHENL